MKNLFLFLFLLAISSLAIGQNENALHFDGVNDRVDLPAKIHDSIPGTGTIEAWIKTTNAGASFRGIVVREFHYGIFLNGNQLMSYNWTGNGSAGATTYTGATLNDNQWHQVALTFQSGVTNGSQLYLDGVPVGSPFTHFENSQAADFRIGTNGLVGQFFQGAIDQVKIYGRVLTPAEINNSYNCIPVSTQKLNGFYNFNQGTAGGTNTGLTTLNDLSGQLNNGTSFNMALTGATSNWVSGYFCQVTPCPAPFGQTTQNFCVSATISNLTATGTSIQWYAAASGGTALTPLTPLVSGNTYYASQTVNSCESSTRLPVLVNIYPLPATPTGSAFQTLCVGSTVSNLSATGSNIKWYAAASGGSPLSSSTGITIGNTYYASQTVNGCESSGRFAVTVQPCQNSLSFDGTSDFVALPQTTLGNNASIEAWIKTSNAGSGFRGIVVREFQYGLFLNDNQLMTYNWTGNGTSGATTYSGVTLNDDQWHHVALTVQVGVVNGTQMYIDGQAVGAPITLFLNGNNGSFRVGCNGNTGNYFQGQIDNVKLWTRTLTSAEVNSSYNCGSVSSSNLVGSYNFNHGQANGTNTGVVILSDQSGSVNDGVLNSFILTGSTSNWTTGFVCSINPCPAPFGPSVHYFCNSGTVGNLNATGSNIQWYTTPTGGTPLTLSTPLLTGMNTYYASQTISSCESAVRYATVVYVTPTPGAPTGSTSQTFCNGYTTLANLVVTGSNILWYSSSSGGTPLSTSTLVNSGSTYYASQTINTCESSSRMAVTVQTCQNALHFDGSNDYIALPSGINQPNGQPGTVEAWIKTSNAGSSYRAIVVRTGHYGIFLLDNQLMFYNFNPGIAIPVGPLLNDNQWHHVAVTFVNGLANAGQLYLDGQPIGTTFTSNSNGSSNNVTIGQQSGVQYYQGLIDNVKIYNRKLTTAEINDSYNCLPVSTIGLLASYNFNQGTANGSNSGVTTLFNETGSNNGNLQNFTLNGSTSNWVNGYDCQALACPTPTGSATQTFCNSATVANLTASGTSIQWYATATGGSALSTSTPLVNGSTYYATQTTASCESNTRLAVTVTINAPAAPTGTASQTFCNSATVANLAATGTTIQWYAASTGGPALAAGTALTNGTTYYASQTVSGCESVNRFAVSVTINAPTAPTGSATQTVCSGAVIGDLSASGSNIQWYAAASGGSALASSTALTNGTTYYATQTVSGCESATRFAVNVVFGIPSAPTGSATQSFCNNATVSNLVASGSTIQWYTTPTGGTALSSGTAVTNGTTYYASQTSGGCESTNRLAVTVTINAPTAPTGTAAQTFCNSATVANLTATGTGIQWYSVSTGGTALSNGTALTNGTYYASQTVSGCESANRLAVTVTINTPAAPTGAAAQTICGTGTLADLSVSGTANTWYDAANGGNTLAGSTSLVDGTTYYASQTISSCESVNRLAVTVDVNPIPSAPTGNTAQTFCSGVMVMNLSASGSELAWYPDATSTTALNITTPLTSGAYYATQTINGCESTDRLEVNVTINDPAAPTGAAQQSFCEGATIDDIVVTGTDIQWYFAPTGGTVVSGSQPLVNSIYYASQTINGCESSNRLAVEVTMNVINSNVTEDELVLTVAQTGASYQWVDCNDGNSPISGATSQSYTVTQNGSYAVEIELNGCSEVSSCVTITTVGLADNKLDMLSVHPNPTFGQLVINSSAPTAAFITSANGSTLSTLELNGETTIDVSTYAPGVYFIRTAEGQTVKFVKE